MTPAGRSVLGALEQAARFEQLTDAEKRSLMHQFALSTVGAVAGYFVGRKYSHPVLGVFGGLGAGNSVALVVNNQPTNAAYVAVVEAAAIGTALWYQKHPAVGYVGGYIGASLLTGILLREAMTNETAALAAAHKTPTLADPTQRSRANRHGFSVLPM